MARWFPIASLPVWNGTQAENRSESTQRGRLPLAFPRPRQGKRRNERRNSGEEETREEYRKQKAAATGQSYALPPEKRRDDFVSFITDAWFPLQINSGNRKPTTVAFYESISGVIATYFNGCVLQEISLIQIQKYLVYLRTEYESTLHKPLSAKSARHHYVTLNSIFGYAEQNELIAKNPMRHVDAPKKGRKPVEAFTQEQARQFFDALAGCPLSFRCMLLARRGHGRNIYTDER